MVFKRNSSAIYIYYSLYLYIYIYIFVCSESLIVHGSRPDISHLINVGALLIEVTRPTETVFSITTMMTTGTETSTTGKDLAGPALTQH